MPSLGRGELERRIDGERPAEFLAALPLAVGRAVDEGEMLVCVRCLAVGQAEVESRLQVARRLGVVAVFILAKAGGERRRAFARLDEIAQRLGGATRQRNK